MCFLLFKDNCITNKCSLCFCVNMSVWSKMLIMSRQSFISPAASSISLLQTNAIFMYNKWGVCLHSVWIYLKPCVCLEVQAGNSPANLVNVRLTFTAQHSVCYFRNAVLVSQDFHATGRKVSWGFGIVICCRKREREKKTLLKRKSQWSLKPWSVSATVVSENIACLTCRHWSLFSSLFIVKW